MDFSDDETIRKMARIFYDEIEKIQRERAEQMKATQASAPPPYYEPIKRPRREELASQHTEWLMSVLRTVCYDSFAHGYRHGVEDTETGKEGRED